MISQSTIYPWHLFIHVSIDYFGSFYINCRREDKKCYDWLFTYLNLRAAHSEEAHTRLQLIDFFRLWLPLGLGQWQSFQRSETELRPGHYGMSQPRFSGDLLEREIEKQLAPLWDISHWEFLSDFMPHRTINVKRRRLWEHREIHPWEVEWIDNL